MRQVERQRKHHKHCTELVLESALFTGVLCASKFTQQRVYQPLPLMTAPRRTGIKLRSCVQFDQLTMRAVADLCR